MASQVLSGNNNPTYTNISGQNVRLIINFMASCSSMSWGGVSLTSSATTLIKGQCDSIKNFPIEVVLSNTQSFAATCGAYNIVVIKEDGN